MNYSNILVIYSFLFVIHDNVMNALLETINYIGLCMLKNYPHKTHHYLISKTIAMKNTK